MVMLKCWVIRVNFWHGLCSPWHVRSPPVLESCFRQVVDKAAVSMGAGASLLVHLTGEGRGRDRVSTLHRVINDPRGH